MIKKLYVKLMCAFGRAIDIKSNSEYPANVLSNFWGNTFLYDGVQCKSMEGFLQSLKHSDSQKQVEICQCRGKKAKHKGTDSWKISQQLYWKGRVIDRHSDEYQDFLRSAYQALFTQNEAFKSALMLTRGKILFHSIGSSNALETVLTSNELCTILTELRDGEDQHRACRNTCSRTHCPFRK